MAQTVRCCIALLPQCPLLGQSEWLEKEEEPAAVSEDGDSSLGISALAGSYELPRLWPADVSEAWVWPARILTILFFSDLQKVMPEAYTNSIVLEESRL